MLTVDRALLTTYLRPEWRRAVLLLLLLLAGIVFQLANPQIVGVFIDRAQAAAPISHLIWLAIALIGVTVLGQGTTVAETYVAEDLGWRSTNRLRSDLTRHIFELDGSFHARFGPGELIERVDGDVTAIADFFARFVVQLLGSIVFLAGVLVLLYLIDWRIGLLLSVCSLLALTYMGLAGQPVAVRSKASRQSAADLSGFIEERLDGIPDIKANGADAYVLMRLHERLGERFRRARSAAMAGSLFNGMVGAIFAVGMGGALAMAILFHQQGVMTLGTIYVVFRYTGMLQVPVEQLSKQINGLQQATGGILRVRELLNTRSKVEDGPGSELPDGPLELEVDGLSFAYETLPVLHDVSFHLNPGETLGLLGRTGSGKTTLSRLIFRLYDATDGSMRLGGVDTRLPRLDDLRRRIGLVTQDVQLFRGSVRDNVTLFDESISDDRVVGAFEALGLGDWLRGQGLELDTRLGPDNRGVSAGEAQLIALARVFLKDPGLVVLDEASSRLDPETLRLTERGIARLLAGRTGIVIAHRLETVERVDTILILEDGRIVEHGQRHSLESDPASRLYGLRRAHLAEVLA